MPRSHRGAIAPKQNRMVLSGRCLRVPDALLGGRDNAFAVALAAESHSGAIAPKQHTVVLSCRRERVRQTFLEGWEDAPAADSVYAQTQSGSIAPNQNRVTLPSRQVRVRHACLNSRDGALAFFLAAESHSGAITPQLHCMVASRRNHGKVIDMTMQLTTGVTNPFE